MKNRIKLKSLFAAMISILFVAVLFLLFSRNADAASESESNDTLATATALSLNTNTTGSMSSTSDIDWYKFTLSQAGYVSVKFSHPTLDSDIYWGVNLYDSKGSSIYGGSKSWDVQGNADLTICPIGLAAGTYYIKVTPAFYWFSSSTYTLNVSFTASATWESENNGTVAAADKLNLNTAYSGNTCRNDDTDYFVTTLSAKGDLTVSFTHSAGSGTKAYWSLDVYSSDGTTSVNDTVSLYLNKASTSFTISGLAAGTYYVKLSPNSLRYSDVTYTLKLSSSAAATSTPKPTATSTPKPTATSTPKPTATSTPKPTATSTPKPTATSTPKPTATSTPKPTATSTPKPTATSTPKPTATSTPKPTSTSTPKPTATSTPKPTATSTPKPTATSTPKPTATSTPKPTATSTPKPTSTPVPTLTPSVVNVTGISLSESRIYILTNETRTLGATVSPSNANNKTLSWASSDKSVVSVDSNGKITPLKNGKAVVTASSVNGKTASCEVVVEFADVRISNKKYYYDAVYWAAEKGITKGYAEVSPVVFRPEQFCTREQMVTFLWRYAGSPEPKTKSSPFSDVKSGQYYYKAVLWAAENGITKGYADGSFGVGKACLREHAVTFLYRLAGSPKPTASSNPFPDVKSSAYYYKAVLWAAENDITKGYTENGKTTYKPEAECLREHIVTFLYRYAQK